MAHNLQLSQIADGRQARHLAKNRHLLLRLVGLQQPSMIVLFYYELTEVNSISSSYLHGHNTLPSNCCRRHLEIIINRCAFRSFRDHTQFCGHPARCVYIIGGVNDED